MRNQHFSGHYQGCRGAALCNWHTLHDLTLSSISVSSPGHHRYLRAIFFIWPFLGGQWSGLLWAVSDPELVSPHGFLTRYNHCVCSTRFSSRRKAPGFCQGIYHPSPAELFWEPDVELGLRLFKLQCDQLSQAWLPGGPLGVLFHPVLGLWLLYQTRVTDWEHQHYHVYIPLGTQVYSRRL